MINAVPTLRKQLEEVKINYKNSINDINSKLQEIKSKLDNLLDLKDNIETRFSFFDSIIKENKNLCLKLGQLNDEIELKENQDEIKKEGLSDKDKFELIELKQINIILSKKIENLNYNGISSNILDDKAFAINVKICN